MVKNNKILLRILHFFGLLKDTYHVDDITIRTVREFSRDEYIRIASHETTLQDVEYIKSIIYDEFEKDPKLEYRCRVSGSVWIYINKQSNYEPGGVLKILFYSEDCVLYYFNNSDMKSYSRDIKIKSILEK